MRFGSRAHLGVLVSAIGFVAAVHIGRAGPENVIEGAAWYATKVATAPSLAPTLLGEPTPDRIDVRGVGDSSWARGATPATGLPTPPPAEFDRAIERVDPSGALLRGDLNFINWESVVGERCTSIRRSTDFYFLTNPLAIRQAVAKGFNLFGLANNHAQDCNVGKSTLDAAGSTGPRMTATSFTSLGEAISAPFVWAGISDATGSDPFRVRVQTFTIGGRSVRVALGAVVSLGWDIPNAASIDYRGGAAAEAKIARLLANFRAADADFRVLSIHTQDGSGEGRPEGPAFRMLKKIAERFVIEASGDAVFGEGPHTWGGVRVVPRADGKSGVIFTGLGNFIHPGLRSDKDNYVARALWDRETLRLREVQVTPFRNNRDSLSTYGTPGAARPPLANFTWQSMLSKINGGETLSYSARFR